jgi:5-methyltetrahydrofolate--homocysteine methyltransferase
MNADADEERRSAGWPVHYTNRPVYGEQKQFARSMRRAPTRAEEVLWQAVRHKAIDGFKFRRQHVIGRFIADFYCAEGRVVIEVDGEIHDHQRQDDADRDDYLRSAGLTVLRFTNDTVLTQLPEVIAAIRQALLTPDQSTPP